MMYSKNTFTALLLTTTLLAPCAYAQVCDPIEVYKLRASDSFGMDNFGASVGISGTMAIAGAWGDDDNGTNSGAAYLFDTTTGEQMFKLLPDDGAMNDYFGGAVAIGGTIAIVGCDHNDDNGNNSGCAYLFDTSTGYQIRKLLPLDGAPGDEFGVSVAVDGDIAVIGAWGREAAYVFDLTTGEQIVKLTPEDTPEDGFGCSVAVSGTTVIVGAYWGDDGNGNWPGSAYLFDATTGQQLHKLLAEDGANTDWFGISVGISGNTAIVGAPADDDRGSATGAAYLFDVVTGEQIMKLLAQDAWGDDWFGNSVAIHGTTAIIGAYGEDSYAYDSGSAYLFNVLTGEQTAKIVPSDGAYQDYFGISSAIFEDRVLVGSQSDDISVDSGSVYLFEVSCSPALSALGSCPGPMTFEVTGATALRRVAFLYARGEGSIEVPPGYPCAGITLDLNGTVALAGVVLADSNGTAQLQAEVPPAACGRIYLQALDLESCATTNVILVE